QTLRPDICPHAQAAAHPPAGQFLTNGKFVLAQHAHTVPCGAHPLPGDSGAGFLFIPDLTNKATGAVLVTLIILYIGTQLASSLMMATPTTDKTQRQIMLLMPLFFVVLIISFPAGLIVYWITTNT